MLLQLSHERPSSWVKSLSLIKLDTEYGYIDYESRADVPKSTTCGISSYSGATEKPSSRILWFRGMVVNIFSFCPIYPVGSTPRLLDRGNWNRLVSQPVRVRPFFVRFRSHFISHCFVLRFLDLCTCAGNGPFCFLHTQSYSYFSPILPIGELPSTKRRPLRILVHSLVCVFHDSIVVFFVLL